MKKSRGVSLVSLIITIVVIIILSGISIYYGLGKNVDETINTMDYNEIFELSEAVVQRALFNRLNSSTYGLIGSSGEFDITIERISGDETIEITEKYSTNDGWYKINPENASGLNLEKIRREYLVNYNTSEIISLYPIYYEGTKYYSLNDLKSAMGTATAIIASDRYDENKGVNRPYVVEGMIPVKYNGTEWVVTNIDDNEWYDYAASNEGGTYGNLWANVMLKDEIEVDEMSNSAVKRATLKELEGKVVTKEGSMFVWIPRCSRGTINGVVKIVYSKLTDDYFKNLSSSDNIVNIFIKDGIQLTGIWVSKYDIGYIEN